MSPHRMGVLALGLLTTACVPRAHPAWRARMPPPAPVIRAGTPDPGAGPAPGSRTQVQDRRPPRDEAVRRAIETASGLVGHRDIVVEGTRFGDGCAALVRAAFAAAGAPLPDSARDARGLHALARERGGTRRGRPSAGDLVFLADRPGGPAEHVGLVESVSAGGTALVLHLTEHGVLRLRVNGAQPWKARAESGRALNDLLVVGSGRITAGRLLVAYATIL